MGSKNSRLTKKNGALRDTLAEKILNVCIIIAVFALVMTIYSFVSEYRDYSRGYFTEENVISNLQYENYAGISDKYYGLWEDASEDPARENISALARYIDAAFMYRAFADCGMDEKAEMQKQRMEENAELFGMFAGERANIDRVILE